MSSKDKKSKSSSKHSSSSKSSSSKHSGAKIAECMKAAFKKIVEKPKHYTARYMTSAKSSIGQKFGGSIVRAALASLEEQEKISFSRKDGGKGKKGQFVIVPLTRKAA